MASRDDERTQDLRKQLNEEIRRDSEDLRFALAQVKHATKEAVSLNRMIRERPALWLGSALAVGFVLGYRP